MAAAREFAAGAGAGQETSAAPAERSGTRVHPDAPPALGMRRRPWGAGRRPWGRMPLACGLAGADQAVRALRKRRCGMPPSTR